MCPVGVIWMLYGQKTSMCFAKRKSPHWGLSPGPSVYRTDALPLSYRGSGSQPPKACGPFSVERCIEAVEFPANTSPPHPKDT